MKCTVAHRYPKNIGEDWPSLKLHERKCSHYMKDRLAGVDIPAPVELLNSGVSWSSRG